MRIGSHIAACAALVCLAGPAAAGTLADVSIYDGAKGRALPVYYHDGRHYVVGRPGSEYRVRVRNRTGEEILAVVSVDGVNAVSGETAAWDQSGYVLSAHQRYDIAGWRKSLERVAAFFFTRHENAYATRTGRPDNVGVIGVAVFKKAPPEARLPRPQRYRGEAADSPFPDSADEAESGIGASGRRERQAESDASRAVPAAPRLEQKLGTGHGRSQASPVTYTAFQRATAEPQEVIAIHYDSYRNLVALGVIRAPRLAAPMPFPGRFVPDPR